jgi:exoribonuclease-2
MQTHAAPHQGLGVDQYAWSTSPLRRYTDLVNQWQIMACVSHTVTAPLIAPFKPKDADLFAIVSAFDGAYAAYADFQNTMERYWCLRWLRQESQRQESQRIVDAVVLKDQMLRLTEIPLVIQMSSLPTLARGAQVKLELLDGDEVDLSVQARLVEVVSTEPALDANALADGEVEEEPSEGEQTTLSATTEVVEPSPANTE